MKIKKLMMGVLAVMTLCTTLPVQAEELVSQSEEITTTEEEPLIIYEEGSDYADCPYVVHWNDIFGYMHTFGLNFEYNPNLIVDQRLTDTVQLLSNLNMSMGLMPSYKGMSTHIATGIDMTPYIDAEGKLKDTYFETDVYLDDKMNEGPNLANSFRTTEIKNRDIYAIIKYKQTGTPVVTREAGKLTTVTDMKYADVDFKPSFYYAQKYTEYNGKDDCCYMPDINSDHDFFAKRYIDALHLENAALDYYYPVVFSQENLDKLPDGYTPLTISLHANSAYKYDVLYFTVTPKEGHEIESVTCDEAISCQLVDEYFRTGEKTEGDIYELRVRMPDNEGAEKVTININIAGMDNSPYEDRTFLDKNKWLMPVIIIIACGSGLFLFLFTRSKKKIHGIWAEETIPGTKEVGNRSTDTIDTWSIPDMIRNGNNVIDIISKLTKCTVYTLFPADTEITILTADNKITVDNEEKLFRELSKITTPITICFESERKNIHYTIDIENPQI